MGIEALEEGRAWKFGDNISTDLIVPGKYFHLRSNLPELAKHVLEGATLEESGKKFVEVVSRGDYIVAGRNFGMGSSREHAPIIIKLSGVGAVLARSFARIFFRNAINIGLPAIECDTSQIGPLDKLSINLRNGYVENKTKNEKVPFKPLPDIMRKILEDGGLVSYVTKNHGLVLPGV